MDPCMRNDTWFPAMRFPFEPPNDTEFSGERKRVRCNELLEGTTHIHTARARAKLGSVPLRAGSECR
jgi:hypothetical protein